VPHESNIRQLTDAPYEHSCNVLWLVAIGRLNFRTLFYLPLFSVANLIPVPMPILVSTLYLHDVVCEFVIVMNITTVPISWYQTPINQSINQYSFVLPFCGTVLQIFTFILFRNLTMPESKLRVIAVFSCVLNLWYIS
jgi:hypothetical protein